MTKPQKFLDSGIALTNQHTFSMHVLSSYLNCVCGAMLSMVKYGIHVKKQAIHVLLNFLRLLSQTTELSTD